MGGGKEVFQRSFVITDNLLFSEDAIELTIQQIETAQNMAKALKLPRRDPAILQFLIINLIRNENDLAAIAALGERGPIGASGPERLSDSEV